MPTPDKTRIVLAAQKSGGVERVLMAKGSEAAVREVERLERIAEAAYEAMYDAQRHNVKDCFEDALAYYSQAIAAARRADLAPEVERLTRRSEHVSSVYNSQFRYI